MISCVGSSILVARMRDNCDAHCYCSLFVMNISSILMVPSIVSYSLRVAVPSPRGKTGGRERLRKAGTNRVM